MPFQKMADSYFPAVPQFLFLEDYGFMKHIKKKKKIQ